MDIFDWPAQRALDHPGRRRQKLISSPSPASSTRHLLVIERLFRARGLNVSSAPCSMAGAGGRSVVEEEKKMSRLPVSRRGFSRREFLASAAASATLIMLHPFSARAAANQAHL